MQQDLSGIDPQEMAAAISDVFEGKTLKFAPEQANQIIQSYIQELTAAQFEEVKTAGEQFLAENKKKAGVHTTASGLQYEVISDGSG